MSAGAVFTLRYTLRLVRRLGSLSIGAFKELRQNKDELKIGNKKKESENTIYHLRHRYTQWGNWNWVEVPKRRWRHWFRHSEETGQVIVFIVARWLLLWLFSLWWGHYGWHQTMIPPWECELIIECLIQLEEQIWFTKRKEVSSKIEGRRKLWGKPWRSHRGCRGLDQSELKIYRGKPERISWIWQKWIEGLLI